jgi:hypothetical protein
MNDGWDTPGDLRDLERAEHMLVWAARAIAAGQASSPAVHQVFNGACGPHGAHVLNAYFALVKLIGISRGEPLRVHAPGCLGVSDDEQELVATVAAAQQDLRNGAKSRRLEVVMERFLDSAPRAGLLSAARAVAHGLTIYGHLLPTRETPPPSDLSLGKAMLDRVLH